MRRFSVVRSLLVLLPLLLMLQVPGVWAAGDGIGVQSDPESPMVGKLEDLAEEHTVAEEYGAQPNAPVITVWYGSTQTFGAIGNPQRQINILGNVTGASQLHYRLNGGALIPLSIGGVGSLALPEAEGGYLQLGLNGDPGTLGVEGVRGLTAASNPRLVSYGDFNIEIDRDTLVDGQNTVVIVANNGQSSETVTVNYEAGNVWLNPYTIDWTTVSNIDDVAEIVDGQWEIDGDAIRPTVTGYDRIVAIGDVTWDDFEVTVPVTIYDWPIPNVGGVGIAGRWQGHFVVGSEQPGVGWWNIGAYAFYRHRDLDNGGPKLAMYTGHYDLYLDGSGYRVARWQPYYFKLRVQTKQPGMSGFYSFKAWRADLPEPSGWTFEVQDQPPDQLFNGSVLLVAHQVDASFGNVSIVPVLQVNVSTVGSGSVQVTPTLSGMSDAYLYGDTINLTANPNTGWKFVRWSGDLTGWQNPATVVLTDDMDITATFGVARNLNVNVVGNGAVELDPPGPVYGEGAVVTISPTPGLGWSFSHWSGPDASEVIDNGDGTWSLTIDGDKSVTANFSQDEYDVIISHEGTGSGEVIDSPGSPYQYGEEAILEPIPDRGSSFDGWGGPHAGDLHDNGDGTWSLTMDGDKNLTANFTLKPHIYLPMIVRGGQ